jgi:hypothetical protein
MKRGTWLLAALLLLLWAVPARADNRVIVRSTLNITGLQQLLNLNLLCGLPLLNQACTVLPLGDTLGQLYLVTTPLDATIFLGILRPLPGILNAELDQLISLIGGLLVPSPLPSGLMSDRTPVHLPGAISGPMVWNSYANQPAATIVHVQNAQTQFNVSGIGGVVADIDTGVDPNHPVLASVLLPGYDFTRNQAGGSELTDFTDPTPQPCPTTCSPAIVNQSSAAILDQSSAAILDQNPKYAAFGHGTMVMGVIHLVAPNAKLLPLKAFHSDGTGYLSDILHAIYYAVQNQPKANVINMSFDFTSYSAELASALDFASQSALISATSAGNDGQREIVYPAALQSDAMGAASTNDMDVRSSFSNYGDAIVWVAAPGEGIVTTYPFSSYAAGWGTSFSAPFVSGTSALLLNKQALTNEPQAAAAVAHAVPVGADMGNGRLDIVKALGTLSPADFSLSANPSSQAINAGQTAMYALSVTPSSAFSQPVVLSCSGAPAASTCVVTPVVVTPIGASPVMATVIVQTMMRAASPPAVPVRIRPLPWNVLVRSVWLLTWATWLLVWTRRRRFGRTPRQRPDAIVAAGLIVVSLCFSSCGLTVVSSPSGPSGRSGSATLSSFKLNPTSVNGGFPSTGSLTLSAPAPSGGAIISLSSGSTAVATLPTTVTVPAGAATAVFNVTTSPVTASTSVIISATFAGVTQTAALTVTPQPPPGPTLTSLSLNPAGVIGGSFSTGSVALSAPAPNGGVLVSISSNNTAAATVPANVTVPAGHTSATFTVTTLPVTASTSVDISASYAGVTHGASLTVTPVPPPGTPAGTYLLTITGTAGNLNHSTNVTLVVK